jgi:hypothetical protein
MSEADGEDTDPALGWFSYQRTGRGLTHELDLVSSNRLSPQPSIVKSILDSQPLQDDIRKDMRMIFSLTIHALLQEPQPPP